MRASAAPGANRCRLRPVRGNLSSVTITRTLALAALLVGARPVSAQILKVPAPVEARIPLALSAGFGFLQTAGRFDGTSQTFWSLGDGLQYRASLDLGLRSGSFSVAGTTAKVPIRRSNGPLGEIEMRQYLATFRTPETEGPHQILEVGAGMSQWLNYTGPEQLTAVEAKPVNALTLTIGYGFGFTVGKRLSVMFVQDMGNLWGPKKDLAGGESRLQRQYITRLGARYLFSGTR